MKDQGLTDEEMGIKPTDDPGLTDEEMGVSDEKPEVHGAASTFGLNLLDSASLVGVPAVIAAKDALFGEESAKASKRTDDDDPRFKEKGILDRYRSNKQWLKKGMGRASDESPIAAVAGQLAPALIPGTGAGGGTLKAMMARGAVTGGAHGLLSGDADTAGGELGDTAIDALAGAGAGAVGEALGSAGGKFMQWMGKKAGSKLESGIVERSRSLLGKYGQKKKDAVAAMKNLKIQDALERAPVVGNAASSPAGRQLNRLKSQFPNAEADLYDASKGNAGKQVRRFVGSQNRFGPSGNPPVAYARKVALRNMMSQRTNAIKDLLGVGVRAGVGAGIGSVVGGATTGNEGNGARYGAAIGGAGGLYVARKLALNVMEHPKMLSILSNKLPGLGKKLSAAGGAGGATTGYLTALFATKQGRQALEESVSEAEMDEGSDFEPQAGEGDGKGKVDLKADDYDASELNSDGVPKKQGKLLENFEDTDERRRRRTAPTGGIL